MRVPTVKPGRPNDKWMQTMINRHGSREAVSAHMAGIGSKGGSKITDAPKGFAADRDRASWAGRKGGAISRRRKANEE